MKKLVAQLGDICKIGGGGCLGTRNTIYRRNQFEKREGRVLRSIKRDQVCKEYVFVVGIGLDSL